MKYLKKYNESLSEHSVYKIKQLLEIESESLERVNVTGIELITGGDVTNNKTPYVYTLTMWENTDDSEIISLITEYIELSSRPIPRRFTGSKLEKYLLDINERFARRFARKYDFDILYQEINQLNINSYPDSVEFVYEFVIEMK